MELSNKEKSMEAVSNDLDREDLMVSEEEAMLPARPYYAEKIAWENLQKTAKKDLKIFLKYCTVLLRQ